MQVKKKPQKRVMRHILTNPFAATLNEISSTETQAMISVLGQEISAMLTQQSITDTGKRLKTEELSSMAGAARITLILGINSIVADLEKITAVVGLKCPDTEVMLEPLAMLCRNSGVPFICANYTAVKGRLREITGVKLLAAFGVPKMNCLPMTANFLKKLSPVPKGFITPKIAIQQQTRNEEAKS